MRNAHPQDSHTGGHHSDDDDRTPTTQCHDAASDPRPPYLTLDGLTVTTWNARALLTPDPDMHFRRWQQVARLGARSQVVCIQEVHSDEDTMRDAAARLLPTHFATFSACERPDTGGVMTMVSLAGDWNFPSDTGGASSTTTTDGTTTMCRAPYNPGPWRTALRATTELGHELPTRAAATTLHDGTKVVTMSSLDRLYTTIAPYVLAEVAMTVEVGHMRDALPANDRGPLSDHVYVRTTLLL